MLEDIYDPKNAVSEREAMVLYEKCPCKPELLKLMRIMVTLSPYQVGVIIGYAERMAVERRTARRMPETARRFQQSTGSVT